MRHPGYLRAVRGVTDLLTLALGDLYPRRLARLLCAIGPGHLYAWNVTRRGGRLACVVCAATPMLGSQIEAARPGCAGCADCTCRSMPWPAFGPRAW